MKKTFTFIRLIGEIIYVGNFPRETSLSGFLLLLHSVTYFCQFIHILSIKYIGLKVLECSLKIKENTFSKPATERSKSAFYQQLVCVKDIAYLEF